MAMRISGIASGLDTDSMVQELVKASSARKEELEKAQTKLGWKQESWKDLNAKVYSFFNDRLSNLSLEGSFIKKKTTIADSTIASVVATDLAVNGSQTLAVKKLAKAGRLTGGKMSSDKSVKGSTTLAELAGKNGVTMDPTDKISLRVNTGGKETVVELRGSSSIDDVLKGLKDAGLSANFDEANQRIFLSSTNTGAENDFTITAGNINALHALNSMGLLSESDISDPDNKTYQEYKFWADAYVDQGDGTYVLDEAILKEKIAEKTKEKAASMLEDLAEYQKKVQDLREERSKLSNPADLNKNFTASEAAQKELADIANVLKDYYDGVIQSNNTLIADQKAIIENADGSATADQIAAAQAKLEELTKENDANKENLIKASQAYAIASSAATAMGSSVPTTAPYKLAEQVEKENRDFAATANEAVHNMSSKLTEASKGAVRVAGSDATIMLNGAEFTSDTNTFNINGLTITATAESAVTSRDANGNPISWAETTINTSDDVDGIYDMVKGFFKQYNDLIKEMDTLYNADSSKGYEPLTDEEKDVMSDTEVEKWEQKIKDSLLRRDGDLGTLINIFKSTMLGTYTVNGKEYSLSSFGINTLSYFKAAENERGVFHIDGDADDSNTAYNVNALKAAIASDPQAVAGFFSQLATDLKGKVNTLMQRTNYRSMYKVYDDKRMQTEYDDYKTKIKEQEKKLQALEDRYYNQFTQMEKALSKLNSQQSYLTSLFGG